jgi:hypothetical protein
MHVQFSWLDVHEAKVHPGPKQPGNDIDVYLRPLVDELLLLWKKEGVRVWDEDKQENFNLQALLFITINDWPALSNLSEHSNKGYQACSHCLHKTNDIHLKIVRRLYIWVTVAFFLRSIP